MLPHFDYEREKSSGIVHYIACGVGWQRQPIIAHLVTSPKILSTVLWVFVLESQCASAWHLILSWVISPKWDANHFPRKALWTVGIPSRPWIKNKFLIPLEQLLSVCGRTWVVTSKVVTRGPQLFCVRKVRTTVLFVNVALCIQGKSRHSTD